MAEPDGLVGDKPGSDEATERRPWRLFLAVEGILLLAFVAGLWRLLTSPVLITWAAWALGGLGAWLFFTLPICLLYLIGRPPVMSLSPLVPSPESRAFRKLLRERPAL